ncbi:hypothetical protein VHEMI00618 [[Torrubiella] hemipterigena]|uniref:Uncharacterized protein n=1 Tax=[Torrubiella] hemipterigena TaxID=1531966 RepID=A0A0A1T2G0_9HYPO|nr:hypothetical protein VHEMI00618 [[Torrubiella] hemipterigena]
MRSPMVSSLLVGTGLLAATAAANQPLVSGAGQKNVIPNWAIQSTSSVNKDVAKLSKTSIDTSSWYHVDSSRCTLMGCLLDAGVYKDDELWFSDNLNHFNWGQFLVPWVYRNEFALPTDRKGQHFLLETNGISSKADIYLNGKQIADKEFQAGAYAGHTYDITDLAADNNALLVRVYPTTYLYDFAVGFVDWNPYSPDNGTGIWRDINIRQTGPVSMSPLSIMTDLQLPVEKSDADITVRAKAQNLEKHEVKMVATASITDPSGKQTSLKDQSITLAPGETKMVTFKETIKAPRIWWPKFWGGQPLYKTKVSFSVDSTVSDVSESSFGIRKVTSAVNSHNDTMFTVNGYPFQVVGGGYGADMFLRWDGKRFTTIAQYMLDMGQNTIRLEGKMEQPELYEIADKIGLMVLAGWECCDKWEAWDYNHDLAIDPPPIWDDHDYGIANASIIHEAAVLQTHPSMLGYMAGSDYWPNDRATKIYVDALKAAGWQIPIIASAAKRGYPALLGPSGMKMDGPYDWVPPNYWFDTDGGSNERLGAAFGFGSELGAGVGTPEIGSLKKFLSQADMDDLWKSPDKGLFHMSNNVSSFYNRKIYNQGLYKRYGAPKSLKDYILKAQLMDYEATRSQYEGYASLWNAKRPATGNIYWMLNNAWPSLHWNQFDYYLRPAGSYFGTKTGSRIEHAAFDYNTHDLWLINHSLDRKGDRSVEVEVLGLDGKTISHQTVNASTEPNKSKKLGNVSGLDKTTGTVFLRLNLINNGKTISRNVYWLNKKMDTLNWADSTWYTTAVTKFADFSDVSKMKTATVRATVTKSSCQNKITGVQQRKVTLENQSDVPAFFISLNLVDANGNDVLPITWSDNYVTLWPHEKLTVLVGEWADKGAKVQFHGVNVDETEANVQ